MKNMGKWILGLALTVTAWSCSLKAQQIPQSTLQLLYLDAFNPAHSSYDSLHHLRIQIQQRARQGAGWRSGSQFLHYQSRSQGNRQVFGWGLGVANDFEHTEQRLSITPSISAKILQKRNTSLSLGIMGGIISWSSDYSNAAVYHPEDPLGINKVNFIEVNAGMGFKFRHHSPRLMMDLGAWGNQLTGSMISEQLNGIRIFPHLLAEGNLLVPISKGVFLGPRAFYKNTVLREDSTIVAGQLDIGLAAQIPSRALWFAGGWRAHNSAVTVGFGFPIIPENHHASPYAYQQHLDLNFGLSYPLQTRNAFGPGIELGIHWTFGKQVTSDMDTLPLARNFWDNQALLIAHKQLGLDPDGPKDLNADVDIYGKAVFMAYEFPDQSLLFWGDDLDVKDSLIRKIGYEWAGVDNLLNYIVKQVAPQALNPDSTLFQDPENLEPLKHLAHIDLSCQLRVDEFGAHFGSEMVYQGEFGFNNPTQDSLFIPIVFDGKDTVVAIPSRINLSNLELAALKLYAMRGKIQYELERQFGADFWIFREDIPIDWFAVEDWRQRIHIRKLRITSDNPNLQAFQKNIIELKFARKQEYWPDEDNGWIMRKDENGDWVEEKPIPKKGQKRSRRKEKAMEKLEDLEGLEDPE